MTSQARRKNLSKMADQRNHRHRSFGLWEQLCQKAPAIASFQRILETNDTPIIDLYSGTRSPKACCLTCNEPCRSNQTQISFSECFKLKGLTSPLTSSLPRLLGPCRTFCNHWRQTWRSVSPPWKKQYFRRLSRPVSKSNLTLGRLQVMPFEGKQPVWARRLWTV